MALPIKDPQGDLSPEPDEYTSQAPDWTSGSAENRVLHIDLKFFRYGTDDKTHAASIALSLAILLFSLIVLFIGMVVPEATWISTVLAWSGNSFLFVAGAAIGRSVGKNGQGEQ